MVKWKRTDNTMVKSKRIDNTMTKWKRIDNTMTKWKRTNHDRQNTTQKTKNWATRTTQNPGVNSGAPEGWVFPVSLVAPVVLLLSKIWC